MRLNVEWLENRVLLSNDAPRILSVTPADGSTTSNPLPVVSITFSEDVVLNEASNPANYELFNSSGLQIPITGASYDRSTHKVTLTYHPTTNLLPADQYSLFVRGDQIHDTDVDPVTGVPDNLTLAPPNQLIVANPGTGNVSVINVSSNGNATLPAVTDFSSGTFHPAAVALADVTGDGLPDLIVLSSGNNSVQIFAGTAAGTFSSTPLETLALPGQSNAAAMVVTDLNGDSLPDIAVADTGLTAPSGTSPRDVSVFINEGSGIFGQRADYAGGVSPIGIVAADFTGDGLTDLAVVSNVATGIESSTYNVSILPQDSNNLGKFLAPKAFDTGLTIPTGMATGDLNQDGLPDIVVSSGSGVRILFNSTPAGGTLSFTQSAALTTTSTSAIAIGRINTDPLADIVAITRTNGGQALVFQNLGGGFFTSPIPISLNAIPSGLALGDLTGDGLSEILVTTGQGAQSAVGVLVNHSTPTLGLSLSAPTYYTVDNAPGGIAVDLNPGGFVDEIATANVQGNDATLLRSSTDGILHASHDIGLTAAVPDAVAVADLNNDHLPDLIIANLPQASTFAFTDSVTILLNQGNGTYAAPITVNVGLDFFGSSIPIGIAVADLTGSGIPDIIVTNPADDTITVIANAGNGTFSAQAPIALGPGETPTGIVAGIFNNTDPSAADFGKVDLAVSHTGATTDRGVTILRGQGDRTFSIQTNVVTDIDPIAIVSADFHEDNSVTPAASRQLDLAVINGLSTGSVQVLRGDGKGHFSVRPVQAAGPNPTSITVGDINSDGFPDLVIGTHTDPTANGIFSDSVTVLVNNRIPGAGNAFNNPLATDVVDGTMFPLQAVIVTDLNQDLFPDVVAVSQGSTNNIYTLLGAGAGLFQPDVGQFSSAGGGIETGLPVSLGASAIGNVVASSSNTLIHATTFTVTSTLVQSNLIVNGGFDSIDLNDESGSLVGWQTAQQPGSHGGWSNQSGTVAPYQYTVDQGPLNTPVPLPPQGAYAAMLNEPDIGNDLAASLTVIPGTAFGFPATKPSDYNGTHLLYQDFQIPDGATQVLLSMRLFYRSEGELSNTATNPTLDYTSTLANQQVRVDIMDPLAGLYDVGAGVLRNIFVTSQTSTAPVESNDPQTGQPYLSTALQNIDLSNFAGRTVRLRIASANNQGKLMVGVDDVKLLVLYTQITVPGINGVHLRNPGFGATTTFGGNSNDPTIVGTVSDVGAANTIVSIEVDPNNDGFGDADDYLVTRSAGGIDDFGHFTTTLPAVLPNGEQILPGPITVGLRVVDRAGLTATTTFTFNFQGPSLTGWTPRGPNQTVLTGPGVNINPHGQNTVSGRIMSVAADPRDITGNTYIVGSDNGGVWKTSDGGANWTPLTDFILDANGNPVPESISSVAYDPRQGSQTIYAATGVADNLPTSHPGVGVLRSDDGGLTWHLFGQTTFAGARISKLVVNSQGKVYVAVASGGMGPGVYISSDMGQTWTNTLTPAAMFLDNGNVLPSTTPIASVTDIAIDPKNEELVWIGLGNINLAPSSVTGGVWQSGDGGGAWNQIIGGHNFRNAQYIIRNQTIPFGDTVGRVTIALPPKIAGEISDPSSPGTQVVYIKMDTTGNGNFELNDGTSMNVQASGNGQTAVNGQGLFKTRDGGRSWSPIMVRELEPPPITHFVNLFTDGHEANEVGALAVDPNNPNVLYVGASTRYPQPGEGTTFGVPRHSLIRVDTTNMRDTNYISPFIMPPPGIVGVAPNDGDDITKATDAAIIGGGREPGSYPIPPGGGYTGEGVFWYDLATTDFGGGSTSLTGILSGASPIHIPEVIHALTFDPRGRLLVGAELGLWRGVNQGFVYDITTGGTGIEFYLGHPVPVEPGMLFTDLNTNLQISDVNSVAIDPYNRNILHISQTGAGWSDTQGGFQYASTNLFPELAIRLVVGPGGKLSTAQPVDDAVLFSIDSEAGPVVTGPFDPTAPARTSARVYRTYQFVDQFEQNVQKSSGGAYQAFINGLDLSDVNNTSFLPLAANTSLTTETGLAQDELLYALPVTVGGASSIRIFESDNSAASWDLVSTVEPGVVDRPTALAFGPNAPGVPAPFIPGSYFVGTASGKFFGTLADGGDLFPDLSMGLPGIQVNGIAADPTNAFVVYAMIDGTGTGKGHVFRGVITRTISGSHITMSIAWTNISGSSTTALPDFPAYTAAIDPRATPDAPNGKLFVGTAVGVYVSTDFTSNTPTWHRLGVVTGPNGQIFTLPNVPVVSLQFSPAYEELAAATQGRGVFQISTDRAGAHVASFSPTTPSNPGFGSITINFNKPVDPRSFNNPNSVISLRGPGGPILVTSVVDVDPTTHLQYLIQFPFQVLDGTYVLTLSQNITDFLGFQLDQDGNLISGEPTDSFTARFAVNTTDNGRFISGVYNDVLHRQTDTGAFLALLPNLDANRFVAQGIVATEIVTSLEARSKLITGYYVTLLGRGPSPTEINGWLAALDAGVRPEDVISAIVDSPEYFQHNGQTDLQFVSQLYLNVLGRTVDSGGLAAYLGIAETTPHMQIVNGLLQSTEYQTNLIESYYANILPTHGAPSDADVGNWVAALQSGMTDEQVQAQFFGSPEYFVTRGGGDDNIWVTSIFHDILGRTVSPADRQAFVIAIQNGVPLPDIALTLLTSPEYRADLLGVTFPATPTVANPRPFFPTFLGRAATPGEINALLVAFGQGGTDESIISSIVSGSEYFNRFGTGASQAVKDQHWLTAIYGPGSASILNRPIDPTALATDLQLMATAEQSARDTFSVLLPNSDEFRSNLVIQVYSTLLGRRPGVVEIANWQSLLKLPSQGAHNPSPHELFEITVLQSGEYFFDQRRGFPLATGSQWVTSLFTLFLGRATSAAETAPFVQQLLTAYQPQRLAVANLIDTSFEHRLGLVNNLYKTYLRRSPNQAELALWTTGTGMSATDETIIATLVASTEYFQNVNLGNSMNSTWLNQVYLDLLGRDRDPGAQGFLDGLNNGTLTRLQVAVTILSGNEFLNRLVTQLFGTYLRRPATPTELANDVAMLQAGTATDESIISTLLASNEYFLLSHPYP
jgi:hypothetical protein